MNLIKYTLVAFFLLLTTSLFGLDGRNKVVFKDLCLTKQQNQLAITLSIYAPKDSYCENECIHIVPTLSGVDQYITLPRITLQSKYASLLERRGLSKEAEAQLQADRVNRSLLGDTLYYRTEVAFESWMDTVSLTATQISESCSESYDAYQISLAENISWLPKVESLPLLSPDTVHPIIEISPAVLYAQTEPIIRPYSEYGGDHKINRSHAAKIYFRQNEVKIDSTFSSNDETIARIRQAISVIQSDQHVVLQKIVIVGFASIEGSIAINNRIAQKRAEALQYLVSPQISDLSEVLDISNMSEDWDGLYDLVESSDMASKAAVLSIIKDVPLLQGREKQLMDLDKGVPYRYMSKHFFPQLRNAGYIQIYISEE